MSATNTSAYASVFKTILALSMALVSQLKKCHGISNQPPPSTHFLGIHNPEKLVATLFVMLLIFPSVSMGAQYDTKYGPIIFDTEDQVVAYGQSLRGGFWSAFNMSKPSEEEVVKLHEELFIRVAKFLGFTEFPGKTTVKFVSSLTELRAKYCNLVPGCKMKTLAFYDRGNNIIWYDKNELNRNLVLHETTHAALTLYFTKPVPGNISEFLSDQMIWLD